MLKQSQKRMKTCRLVAGINIEHTRQIGRLVCHDTYRTPVQTTETDNDVLGKVRHHFEEVLVVQHRFYNILDVIRHVRVFGDDGLKRLYPAMDIVGAGSEGSILHIVGR